MTLSPCFQTFKPPGTRKSISPHQLCREVIRAVSSHHASLVTLYTITWSLERSGPKDFKSAVMQRQGTSRITVRMEKGFAWKVDCNKSTGSRFGPTAKEKHLQMSQFRRGRRGGWGWSACFVWRCWGSLVRLERGWLQGNRTTALGTYRESSRKQRWAQYSGAEGGWEGNRHMVFFS